MKSTTKKFTLQLSLIGLATITSNAAIVITPTFQDIADAPVVSNTDLAQTAVADPANDITAVSTDALGAGTRRLGLFNGAVGDGTQNTNEADYIRVNNGSTLTINFDISSNVLGYDLTGITSVFNWDDRADQGFEVSLGFVGGGTGILVPDGFHADQNPQNSTQHYSIVTILNDVGGTLENDAGVIATGVQSVTFTYSNLRNPSVAGEVDILGDATAINIPEPSSTALLGLGGLLLASRRRR